tara:strand:- start:170 stop:433 length:264 start_codon:yes stop_codon:yes gene_type:complete
MQVSIKKTLNIKEHGLRAKAGEKILVSKVEAERLFKKGLVNYENEPILIKANEVEESEKLSVVLPPLPNKVESEKKTPKSRKKKSDN